MKKGKNRQMEKQTQIERANWWLPEWRRVWGGVKKWGEKVGNKAEH